MASRDDYSDVPKEVSPDSDVAKDPERVAAGYKATISNPQTSDQAKSRARAMLEEMEKPNKTQSAETVDHGDDGDHGGKDPKNVARGLKATISNQSVSEEARKNAKERLKKQDF
ncbi:Conidiation-specific protein 6 [Metarhizium rileyi]|uniref:Conidiation-specific protein 6 n=1 Tax=Metarhizium rileyi (strain RCEF 4871) TaxID=1649241 RepID=A0A167B754_METRR|nr:Conidiation-specific protein 6 [Metarhizium rileyi RCEF 4871]TWU75401.1 hypothetical protein ED733_002714 [Metarhizium rileyi]